MRDSQLYQMTSGLAVAFAMFTPVAALGQEVGERVRVTLEGDTMVVGFVTAIRSGELELAREGGGRQVVFQNEVERLDRSVERRQWKWGSLIGAGVGAGLGVALCSGWLARKNVSRRPDSVLGSTRFLGLRPGNA